mmetsp:Transcript_40961/g.88751  ORF Transcript_40961/g.88751 Transcript_40961/m.88751 type:complete len:216 (+) Transcript_40961:35-682(+)
MLCVSSCETNGSAFFVQTARQGMTWSDLLCRWDRHRGYNYALPDQNCTLALGRVVQACTAMSLGHKGPTHRQADAELAHDLPQQWAGLLTPLNDFHEDFPSQIEDFEISQSTAFDGANQLRVGEDEIFAPDRAVGSHTAVQGNDAFRHDVQHLHVVEAFALCEGAAEQGLGDVCNAGPVRVHVFTIGLRCFYNAHEGTEKGDFLDPWRIHSDANL